MNLLRSSFPRRRESIRKWIPAFAGMTNNWFKNTFIYDLFGKRSYAQCGEDLIALELLKDIKKGTYLEIGAYHPKVFSNTYLFYKKGWRGTVVEPNEGMAGLFKKSRPEDLFVEAGIVTPPSPPLNLRGGRGSYMDYYVFEEETRNTFSKEMAERYQRAGYRVQRTERKKMIQLGEVLKKNVDLLSIDTEGLDEEIVKALVKTKVRPKVIIVEGEGAGKVLEKAGYSLMGKTPYSLIYNSSLDESDKRVY